MTRAGALTLYSNLERYVPDRKPPIGAVLNPYLSINRGLALYSVMWEGAGDTVEDVSGNGNDGIFVGDTLWVPGQNGPAVYFDGVNDWIIVADSPSLKTAGNQITIIFSFKPVATAFDVYVGKLDATHGWYVADNGSSQIIFASKYSGVDKSHKAGTINYGVWNHAACTYDGKTRVIYHNGLFVGSELNAEGLDGNIAIDLLISHNAYDVTGMIGYVYVYFSVLSASEIAFITQEPFCGFRWTSIEQLAAYIAEAPPEIQALYMDLATQIWTVKHSTGLFTKL